MTENIKTSTTQVQVTNELIKKVALKSGFKLKPQANGEMDLNPYVYEFAKALIKIDLIENENKGQKLLDIFNDLMVEDRQKAIELSTGLFVSSIIVHLETEGHEANKDIRIQGGEGQRDITIHAINS